MKVFKQLIGEIQKKNLYFVFFQTFVAILALAAVALADQPGYAAPAYETYPDVAPLYNFGYNVYNQEGYDHQNFNHKEDRDGYQTHGEYTVQLPDGRLQRVVYQVDGDSGFIADVSYEGEANYDAYKPAPKPAYKPAPKPVYKPAPAPIVYKPAPAPVVYKPAPKPVYKPAPTYKPAPAPVVYKPAPKPAPKPAYAPAYSGISFVLNDQVQF